MDSLPFLPLLVAFAGAAFPCAGQTRETSIIVDFSKSHGEIRPLHGVNNGPSNTRGGPDLGKYFTAAGIPSCRLHDVPHSGSYAVDIAAIFPLAHADPDDPRNYRFERTDDYIDGIVKTGADIVYRLGNSIEHSKRKYDVHPPADPHRWARVCINIIRHYNEGWADGFHHNIRYWEIWNEPDLGTATWTGTPGQYFQLYDIAAKAIKAHDPKLKVGGPGLAGNREFLNRFLASCRERKAPLDFMSWHQYASSPQAMVGRAESMRVVLDSYGFTATESHLNEWHFFNGDWKRLRAEPDYAEELFEDLNGISGAAFACASLLALQDAPLDVANYYTGDTTRWGLFNNQGQPRKTYHAFKAFGDLNRLSNRVSCTVDARPDTLCAGAAVDRQSRHAAILLSHTGKQYNTIYLHFHSLPWAGKTAAKVHLLDATHDLSEIESRVAPASSGHLTLESSGPAVYRIVLSPASGR